MGVGWRSGRAFSIADFLSSYQSGDVRNDSIILFSYPVSFLSKNNFVKTI